MAGSLSKLLARWIVRRPGRVVALGLTLSVLLGALAWGRLGISTDRLALIGERHRYNRIFRQLRDEAGDLDAMVVLLQASDRARTLQCADALARRLSAAARPFRVFHRVPLDAFHGKQLLFLPLHTLTGIERRLRAGERPLVALRQRGLGAFYAESGALVRELVEEPGAGDARGLSFLPAFVGGLERALAGEAAGEPPWAAWVPPDALAGRDGSTWTGDGRLVVLVQPWRAEGEDLVEASVAALRAELDALRAEFPAVEVALTGEPVLEADELRTYRADAVRATLVSLLGVALLVLIAMKRWLGPLLALVAVSSAVACTLGVATIWPGRLNLISLALCALMVGLGIDYAIHWISRYDEERIRGLSGEAAVEAALRRGGRAIAAGSLTTALAFLATLFTEVAGIREFGVIAAVGVLLSLVANLVLLPALVILADRGPGGRPHKPYSAWPRSRLALGLDRLVERHPGRVLAGAALATALALGLSLGSGRLRYDSDLLALQDHRLDSVRLASEMLHDPALANMFAAALVDDLETLRRVEGQLRALPSVGDTASVLDVLPRQQPEKLAALARLRARAAAVSSRGGGGADAAAVASGLATFAEALEVAGSAALRAGRPRDAGQVVALQERAEALVERLSAPSPAQRARLAAHADALQAQLDAALAGLLAECASSPITSEELPPGLRERLIGRSGKLLLRVYPARSVWKQEPLARFVTEVKQVVPDVGGVPVSFYESDRLIRRGYLRAAQIALLFVLCYLVVHFRSALHPLAAATTLLVGASWGAGLLALFDLPLNPANLLALPLTCGIGIDYAIHVIHREREVRRLPVSLAAPAVLATSSGRAVWLSSLTTIVGFGALTLSSHRGVASIGWTVCLGVLGCLLAAVLVCPALLRVVAGPTAAPRLRGLAGPKTQPGGGYRRPPPPELGDDPEAGPPEA